MRSCFPIDSIARCTCLSVCNKESPAPHNFAPGFDMNTSTFWEIIEEANKHTANSKAVPGWLQMRFGSCSEQEIMQFAEHLLILRAQVYDARLWAAAILLMGGFCSDDKFDDFRYWLIAQGKALYEAAVNDPDALGELEHINGDYDQPLLFDLFPAVTRAFNDKTGADEIPLDYDKYANSPLQHEGFWSGDIASLAHMLPKLYAKYANRKNE